ncbi:long-chain acyl-CoA synthetase [Albimonas donghaensis]|uniref:3-methylmercaptopropionyl-CoA ligase n=1 Tax=Albimonas donghaensis TaxID=356660 RepID=A0A1H3AVT2_9RHOB|nr:fatty acid--CoA ligase [Albimonas donghaensis]SDX33518.1 long-chain acyl-CoA synthetase [Albimonas donghaensis]
MIDVAAMSTLGALARANARRKPDGLATRFEGREATFAEFDAQGDQVARALDAEGAKAVAYLGKNSDLAFQLFLGAARAGVVFGPINWRLAPPEIAQIVAGFGADMLFVGPEFIAAVESIRAELPPGIRLVTMEGGQPEWPDFPAWRDAQPAGFPDDRVTPDDVALVLFTSGTTGLPKGVMTTHANLLGQRRQTLGHDLSYDTWAEDEVSLVAMPFAHIGGIGWWVLGFANCAPSIIAREFRPDQVLDFIRDDGVSRMFIVPAALQIVVRDPRAATTDFSRLRHVSYGAAPMPLPLLQEAMEVLGCEFAQCYGMTETTGTICLLPPSDHPREGSPRMRSAGRAMPGSELRVIDPEGNTLPVGEIGEVAVRGGNVTPGYWRNPEATAKTMLPDGWLRSGDAGYMDADGYLYIHDRIKDMIVSGGENVYPAEVESALYAHPDVGEAAVIGVPDPRWGEAVKAIVTAKAGRKVDPVEVEAWIRTRIAAFKCPKSVDVIDEMPRNASGKLLKRDLRAPYWEGRDRQVN